MRLVYHVLNGAGATRGLSQVALLEALTADRMGKVSTPARYMWVILALTAVDGICYRTQKDIAELAGLSAQTVSRYIAELERAGYVQVHKA